MLILGSGAIARVDGAGIMAIVRQIADTTGMTQRDWNGFNVLHRAASRVGGLDLGLVPRLGGQDVAGIITGAASGAIEIVYLLGADEIDMSGLGGAFVIYQGHHGDAGAERADVVLPGAAYTEKDATYVNTEGRVQRTHRAVFPPGDAREDWRILRALSEVLGHRLQYNDLDEVRMRMREINPVFGAVGVTEHAAWKAFDNDGKPDATPFELPINNYYMTDPISRASETMAACTQAYMGADLQRTGTHD